MTKSRLIQCLTERSSAISAKEMERLVNVLFESVAEALSTGRRVELRGFGTFEVRVRDPRPGRNPKSGKSVALGPRRVPFFRAGKELKELVNHGSKPRP